MFYSLNLAMLSSGQLVLVSQGFRAPGVWYLKAFTHWTGRQVWNELVSLRIEFLRYKKGLLFADSFHESCVIEQLRLTGTLPPVLCNAARPAPPVCLGPRGPGMWGFGTETGNVPAGTQGTHNTTVKTSLSATEASV